MYAVKIVFALLGLLIPHLVLTPMLHKMRASAEQTENANGDAALDEYLVKHLHLLDICASVFASDELAEFVRVHRRNLIRRSNRGTGDIEAGGVGGMRVGVGGEVGAGAAAHVRTAIGDHFKRHFWVYSASFMVTTFYVYRGVALCKQPQGF